MSQKIWYDDVMAEYTNIGLDVPGYFEIFSSPIRDLYPAEQSNRHIVYPNEQSNRQEILEYLPYVSSCF